MGCWKALADASLVGMHVCVCAACGAMGIGDVFYLPPGLVRCVVSGRCALAWRFLLVEGFLLPLGRAGESAGRAAGGAVSRTVRATV